MLQIASVLSVSSVFKSVYLYHSMFNKNKKQKSKIRFQQHSFKNKLNEARNYKRPVRKLPEKNWEIFLHSIGFGSWWSRILAVLAVALVVYVVYIPNFLDIKNI